MSVDTDDEELVYKVVYFCRQSAREAHSETHLRGTRTLQNYFVLSRLIQRKADPFYRSTALLIDCNPACQSATIHDTKVATVQFSSRCSVWLSGYDALEMMGRGVIYCWLIAQSTAQGHLRALMGGGRDRKKTPQQSVAVEGKGSHKGTPVNKKQKTLSQSVGGRNVSLSLSEDKLSTYVSPGFAGQGWDWSGVSSPRSDCGR